MKAKIVRESIELDEGLFGSRKPKFDDKWNNEERGSLKSKDAINILKKEPITGHTRLEIAFKYIGDNWRARLENDFWNMGRGYTTTDGTPCISNDFKIIHADKEVGKTVVIVEVDILNWYEFVRILDLGGNGLFSINKIG